MPVYTTVPVWPYTSTRGPLLDTQSINNGSYTSLTVSFPQHQKLSNRMSFYFRVLCHELWERTCAEPVVEVLEIAKFATSAMIVVSVIP